MNKNYKGSKEKVKNPGELKGTFFNTGKDPRFKNAKLYFQDMQWGEFSFGQTHHVNTYHGHEWNVRDPDGNILKKWTVAAAPDKQEFRV